MKQWLIWPVVIAGWFAAMGFEAPSRTAGKDSPLVYQLPSPQNLASGTIRFSFTWSEPDMESFISLVQLDGADGMLRLYIYPHSNLGFLALRTFSDKSRNVTLPAARRLIDRWRKQPEAVHRVVLTWTPVESRLYLDGFPVSIDSVFAKRPLSFSRIIWGGLSVRYEKGKAPVLTGRRYELGKLEIKPEVMSPDAVIADWRSIDPDYKETDCF